MLQCLSSDKLDDCDLVRITVDIHLKDVKIQMIDKFVKEITFCRVNLKFYSLKFLMLGGV